MTRCAGLAALTLGLLLASFAAEAQTVSKMARIGLLVCGAPEADPAQRAAGLRGELGRLGRVEGRHYVLESRYAEARMDRLAGLAAELVGVPVDLIVAECTLAALAAKQATTTVPIVFDVGADPVERGLVASYNRPGGNVTGFTAGLFDEKRLQLLTEAVPRLARVGWLCECKKPLFFAVASVLGVQLQSFVVEGPKDLDRAVAQAAAAGVGGLGVMDFSWSSTPDLRQIAELAARHRLPSIGPAPEFADSGGLLYYGPKPGQNTARVAAFVDRILKGAKPADIPVERPTLFELVVNLRTAKTLRLTIPDPFFARVDRVIE